MTPRSAQVLTAALAGLLVVLIGATVFVLLNRPTPGPSLSLNASASVSLPSPSATSVAVVTASPSAPIVTAAPETTPPETTPSPSPAPTPELTASPSPGLTPSPTPLITPSPTPLITPSPTPEPTPQPTPTPSPTPSITPTSPERSLRLVNVGFDSMAEGGDARYVEVNVDGPSVIKARVSSVSGGTVRLCIIRQDRDTSTVCNTRNGPATVVVTDEGSSVWLIQAQGRAQAAPTGTLTITFNSLQPVAKLTSFRYNGTSDPARNGFTAEFSAGADGQITARGNFEDNSFNYRVTIQPCSDAACDQTGTGGNFEATANGSAGTAYTVRVASPDETTGGGAAFVQSTISWQ